MALVNYSDLIKSSGSTWRSSSGPPSDTIGVDGDWYLDSTTGNYYGKDNGTYSLYGNLKGNDGAPGPAGSDGAPGPVGPAGPIGPSGNDGQDADPHYQIEDVEATGTNRVSSGAISTLADDCGKILLFNSSSTRTLNLTSGLNIGWNCLIRNVAGGSIIISPGGNTIDDGALDVSVDEPKRYIAITHEGNNKFYVAGDVTVI